MKAEGETDSMEDFGPVTVGDLKGTTPGSGARRNGGKPQWFQFPFWAAIPGLNYYRAKHGLWDAQETLSNHARIMNVVGLMSDWQRGGRGTLLDLALAETAYVLEIELSVDRVGSAPTPFNALVAAVRVLEFGAIKYAIGNWARGMSWNVTFSSTMSHLLKYLAGESPNDMDEESMQPHLAHVFVNLLFLIAYQSLYPEGDDRVPEFRSGPREGHGVAGMFRADDVRLVHGPDCQGCRDELVKRIARFAQIDLAVGHNLDGEG